MTGNTTSRQHILLGEYTLGLLNPSETTQAHALLGSDAQAVADALAWENRLLELTDLLPPVDPSPLLLQRIQASLGHDTSPTPASLYRKPAVEVGGANVAPPEKRPPTKPLVQRRAAVPLASPGRVPTSPVAASSAVTQPLPVSVTQVAADKGAQPDKKETAQAPQPTQRPDTATAISRRAASPLREQSGVWFWRLASLVLALIALALGLMPAEPVEPPVTIVQVAPTEAAILQAPGQSSTPAWVVTVDPQGNVLMRPKVHSDIAADASVQLWTHNSTMPAPRSLGLIDPNQPVTVPATLMGKIAPDQIFEMTLEPAGGSPVASPSGPVLFIGRIVTFGRPAPPPLPAGTQTQG